MINKLQLIPPQKPTEQMFQDIFRRWNILKFDNKLPNYKIKFRKMQSFGNINYEKKLIQLNSTYHIDSITNTLLHEMIHAELHRRGGKRQSHSIKFWRMFVAKGGEITSTNKKLFGKARQVATEAKQ